VRHSVWELHPYDETLTGLEDLAWAKWVKEHGNAITYVPEAEIIHVHDETARGVMNRYQRESMAFKKIYPEAHFSLYDFVRMSTANISSDLWHAARQHRFLPNLPSILWFRAAQFWGTYQGYRHALEWNWQLRQTFYFPHGRQAPEKSAPRAIEPIRYNE
jgi:rhamnosyltransferase